MKVRNIMDGLGKAEAQAPWELGFFLLPVSILVAIPLRLLLQIMSYEKSTRSRLAGIVDWPWRSSQGFIVLAICVATFSDGFIYGLSVPAIPFLLRDYGSVPEDRLQIFTSLLVAGFSTTDIVAAPLCAYFVDKYGNKRAPWTAGIVLFVSGTIFFGVGNNFVTLLFSRFLQGASSAILYTVGLAILVDTVDREEVGRWMGTAMSCNNIGIIISPLVGGVIYEKGGKIAVFSLMISLCVIDIILRGLMRETRTIQETKAPEVQIPVAASDPAPGNERSAVDSNPEITEPSATTSTLSLSTTLTSSTNPRCTPEQTSPKTYGTTTTAPTLIPPTSSKEPTPQIPHRSFASMLYLLRNPRFLTALYGCFINEFLTSSLLSVLPLFTNQVFGWTALASGLLFLTIAIPALFGPLAGYLADRLGPRPIALTGFLLTTPPLLLLRLVEHEGKEQMVLLCVLLALAGCSIILFLSPLGADVSFVAEEVGVQRFGAPDALYASSFSLVNTSLALAGLAGPLAAGGVQEVLGWNGTTVLLGVVCASGVVPCALYTGTKADFEVRSGDAVQAV